jgi:uncharacterized repeat protein (TIGR03803 family)
MKRILMCCPSLCRSAKSWPGGLAMAALFLAPVALRPVPAQAQTEAPIYSFKGGQDGDTPEEALLFDRGSLFGTTFHGGGGLGTVFSLTRPAKGEKQWTKTLLHSFAGEHAGDGGPSFSPVVADKAGNLYGATVENGGGVCCGLIYKLTRPAAGETVWTETLLYDFSGNDGNWPYGGLTMDATGALYGATKFGGAGGFGTVFKLTPPAPGQTHWTETTLYTFLGGSDGSTPNGDLLLDSSGVLIGTTFDGGVYGLGTAFVLTPVVGQTSWEKSIIHDFQGVETDTNDGANPNGGLVGGVDDVFGTTQIGGAAGPCCGMVFELKRLTLGFIRYELIVHHTFTGGQDGAYAMAGLMQDAAGTIWGTTTEGGLGIVGTIFKLTPDPIGSGVWQYGVAYDFKGGPNDGASPQSLLTMDKAGHLYGTTSGGGAFGFGTAYKLIP